MNSLTLSRRLIVAGLVVIAVALLLLLATIPLVGVFVAVPTDATVVIDVVAEAEVTTMGSAVAGLVAVVVFATATTTSEAAVAANVIMVAEPLLLLASWFF